MHEAQVERIISKAVKRERRLWLSLFAFAFIFTLYRTPVQVLDTTMALRPTNTAPVNRRMLQAIPAPEKGKSVEISAEPQASPAAEALSLLQDPLVFTPASEVLDASLVPAIEETILPPPKKFSPGNATDIILEEQCQCPPGPPGPKVSSFFSLSLFIYAITSNYNNGHFQKIQGESAPDFLGKIFSFDETRGILKIDTTTIELTGNLVINGFTGVKQSLFIGGDPSNGSPSTEVAAGKVLIYGAEGGQGPTITGFTAGKESGFTISKLTVQGELWEDPEALGQPKRVSTGLF
jgi:hypothetical protein